MQKQTLRVLPVGTALVTDFEAMEHGIRRFIGRQFAPVEDAPGRFGFVPTGQAAEVPLTAEYVRALHDGSLEPADEATARAVGLPWKKAAPPSAAAPTTATKA